MYRSSCFAACVVSAVSHAVAGGEPFEFEPFVTGVEYPVGVAQAPGDDSRLFVFTNPGVVRVVRDGVLLEQPFLDISDEVDSAGELGFYCVVFDPGYQANGTFYFTYTESGSNDIIIEKAQRLDADRADESTRDVIHVNAFIGGSHNGGWLGFHPTDGYLYFSAGDGERPTPPPVRAQQLDNRYGKILRIDPGGDDFPADPERDYAIPPGNPFVGVAGAMEEIWAYGLRNPWRCAFDRATGDLFMGDVGRLDREEISVAPSGVGGLNFGWPCYEGTTCTVWGGCGCDDGTLVAPVHDYDRGTGGAVVGGIVYRGSDIPALDGVYLFADFVQGRVFTGRLDAGGTALLGVRDVTADVLPGSPLPPFLTSFGEDNAGELYLCDRTSNTVYKAVSTALPCVGDCDGSGAVDFNDLVGMLFEFGQPDPTPGCDADGSGVVDFNDLVAALFVFGDCP